MAGRIKEELDLSHEVWGARLNEYLTFANWLLTPNMIILGGGISKKFDRYKDQIDVNTIVIPATLRNKAGIIGAAAATTLSKG